MKFEIPEGDYYMAHPFDTRNWVRKWELKFEERSGLSLINPFYDIRRKDIDPIDTGRSERYEKIKPEQIVLRDLEAIKKAKYGLIGFVTGDLSYGTIMEIAYGKIFNKKVYTLITNKHENHPWLVYHSTKTFTKLNNLERFLIDNYGIPKSKR